MSSHHPLSIPKDLIRMKEEHNIPWMEAFRIYRGLELQDMASALGMELREYREIEIGGSTDGYRLEMIGKTLCAPVSLLST